MGYTKLNGLDVTYDNKSYGNLIDPSEWNANFKKIEEICNYNSAVTNTNFTAINSTVIPSPSIDSMTGLNTDETTIYNQLQYIADILATKANTVDVNNLTSGAITNVSLDDKTGIYTFTKQNGETFTIDTALEKIPATFALSVDGNKVYLVVTNMDGSATTADVTQLLDIYTFNDSDEIDFTTDGYTVDAKIKDGSIQNKHLSTDLMTYLDEQAIAAKNSARGAEASKDVAEDSADKAEAAKAVAVQKAIEAESYAENAKSYSIAASTKADEAALSATAAENARQAVLQALNTKADKSKLQEIILLSSGWEGDEAPYIYTLAVTGVTATSIQEILPSLNITRSELSELQAANIQDAGQSAGIMTLKAFNVKPSIDIPVRIILRGDM